jgi:hypothetical protein
MLDQISKTLETIVKRIMLTTAVIFAAVATGAFAQTNESKTPQMPAQGAGMGHAGKTNPGAGASAAGANSNGGTLMQKREAGMAPDGASGPHAGGATGKMSQ